MIAIALCAASASAAESDLRDLVPTQFAGLRFQVTPDFLPAGVVPDLVASIASKWEDDMHKLVFYVVRASSEETIGSIAEAVASVTASVLADSAWLPEWSWIPSTESVKARRVEIRLAEGMGYGAPTFAAVASWTDGNLAFGLSLSGPADEYSRDVLLTCVAAWISGREVARMPTRDDDPKSPYALFRNSRDLAFFRPAASADYAREALEGFRRADLPLWIAAAELQLGRMLLESSRLDEAEEHLTAARESFADLESGMGEATALIALATADHLRGNPARALERADAAYALAIGLREEPSMLTSDIRALQGCVYFGATLWHKAREFFEQALAQDEEMDDRTRAARDESNLAVFSLATEDYPGAFDRLRRAVAIRPYVTSSVRVPTWSEVQDRLRDVVPPAAATWWVAPPLSLIPASAQGYEMEMNLASAYVQLGLLDDAHSLLEHLLQAEEAAAAVRGGASSWIGLANLSYATSATEYLSGELDDSIRSAERALHYANRWGREVPVLYTELLLGHLRLEAGAVEDVLAIVADALARCFTDDEAAQEKVALLLEGACPAIVDSDVDHWTYAWQFASLLASTLDTTGDPVAALQAAECALGLLEEAFERSQAGTQDLTSVWPLPWRQPFETCVRLQMDAGETTAALQTAESAKARSFLNTIRATSILGDPGWVSAADIDVGSRTAIDSLQEREAVFEYFATDDALFLWVVTADETIGLHLPYPRADVLRDTLTFRQLIESPGDTIADRARLQTLGRTLYDRLVQPGVEHLASRNTNTLILIPSGPLWYLPFAALPVPIDASADDTLGTSSASGCLVDEYTLAYLPSLSSAPHLGAGAAAPSDWDLLGLANPVLSEDQIGRLGTASPQFAQLEDAARGFAAALGVAGDDIVVGDAATERLAKSGLATHQAILFACHGSFDALNPLYSTLYLSAGGQDDGDYHAWEVLSEEPLDADLVILAACETLLPALKHAAGMQGEEDADPATLNPWLLERLTTGDEVVGFSQAFLSRGADTVVGTLWQANPDAVEQLLQAFAENLSAGLPRAKALQKAQHRLIGDGQGPFSHPWLWAPFQSIGAWR